MSELNPNHPVTQKVHDNWHKLCALVMVHCGLKTVDITLEDINALQGMSIAIRSNQKEIVLFLVTHEEALKLAKAEGGLTQ